MRGVGFITASLLSRLGKVLTISHSLKTPLVSTRLQSEPEMLIGLLGGNYIYQTK